MRFFDPSDERLITQRLLPHWAQDGCVVFITWRTADSMPRDVLDRWRAERNRWLNLHGIDPLQKGWKTCLQELPSDALAEYHDRFTTRWHEALDSGHGACVLAHAGIASLISDSLLHFNGDRYEMLDFVIMPNHIHLLATFPDKASMVEQCASWKHFTARQIHRRLGTQGRFWQQDAFDHLVRHEGQFRRLRDYIAQNPLQASLRVDQECHWSTTKPPCTPR